MVFVHHVQLPGLANATIGLDSGVLVFFVLSGFLIYRPFVGSVTLQRTTLASYAIRRLLRIAPAYLVAAFAIATLNYPGLLADSVGLATSLHSSIVVVWTLQIEATFYLFIPAFAFAIRLATPAQRSRSILLMTLASLLFTLGVICVSIATHGFVRSSDVSTVVSYLWAFGAGMVVAELHAAGNLARPVPPLVLVAGISLVAVSSTLHLPKFLHVPAAIGAALVIAYLVSRPTPARSAPLFAAAGAVSYSVYLWHEAIIEVVDRPATWSGAAEAAVITLAIASLIYVLVERPLNRFARAVSRRIEGRSPARERDAPVMPMLLAAVPVETAGRRASVNE